MRKKRLIQAGKCYHLVSRVAHRAFFLDDDEKDRFVDLLMRVEFFCCVKVLASCCMSHHIPVFIFLDDERELSEEGMLARVNALYRGARLEEALGEWKALKEEDAKARASFGGSGIGSDFSRLRAAYARRMWWPARRHEEEKDRLGWQVLPPGFEGCAQGVLLRRRGEGPVRRPSDACRVLLLRQGPRLLLHVEPHPRFHLPRVRHVQVREGE